MVSIRITIFVLMFILLHVKDSSAHIDQAMERNLAAHVSGVEVAGRTSVQVEKEFYDGVPAASEVANTMVGGRKMTFERALGKKMVQAEGLINGEDSKNSGAAHSVGNCDHRGNGILNVESKLRNRSPHPGKVKRAGLTAFSADYNVPKSHPPKNN